MALASSRKQAACASREAREHVIRLLAVNLETADCDLMLMSLVFSGELEEQLDRTWYEASANMGEAMMLVHRMHRISRGLLSQGELITMQYLHRWSASVESLVWLGAPSLLKLDGLPMIV